MHSMTQHYDLYAIGNALVDSEYEVTDAQLQTMGVEKRHMTLIDADRKAYLQGLVKDQHSRRTGGWLGWQYGGCHGPVGRARVLLLPCGR